MKRQQLQLLQRLAHRRPQFPFRRHFQKHKSPQNQLRLYRINCELFFTLSSCFNSGEISQLNHISLSYHTQAKIHFFQLLQHGTVSPLLSIDGDGSGGCVDSWSRCRLQDLHLKGIIVGGRQFLALHDDMRWTSRRQVRLIINHSLSTSLDGVD